jgi:hypothetical protein
MHKRACHGENYGKEITKLISFNERRVTLKEI